MNQVIQPKIKWTWYKILFDSFKKSVRSLFFIISILFGGFLGYLIIFGEWLKTVPFRFLIIPIPIVIIWFILIIKDLAEQLVKEKEKVENLNEQLVTVVKEPILYRRKIAKWERKLSSDGHIIVNCTFEIQVLADELSSVTHRISRTFRKSPQITDFDIHLTHHSYERGEVGLNVLQKSPTLVSWMLNFIPPVHLNESVTYSVVYSYGGAHLMSYEELLHQIQEGNVPQGEEYETAEVRIVVPTDRLISSILLPEDFLVTQLSFDVRIGLSRHNDEIARLRKTDSFIVEKKGTQWFIELDVDQPKIGLTYQLTWIPPRKK